MGSFSYRSSNTPMFTILFDHKLDHLSFKYYKRNWCVFFTYFVPRRRQMYNWPIKHLFKTNALSCPLCINPTEINK